jgi:hypothetical protein
MASIWGGGRREERGEWTSSVFCLLLEDPFVDEDMIV